MCVFPCPTPCLLPSLSPCVCRVIHPHVCASPFPCLVLSSLCVCVRQCTCTVCVLLATHQHSALLSSFLSCLLFLSLFHHHHPRSWGHHRERKECGGKGKEEEERCVIQKGMQKGSTNTAKRRRHLVFPPCLQPLSKPRPFTLHFTHHTTSRAFLLVWPSLFLQKHTLVFTSTQEVSGLCDVKQPHKSATPFLVPTLFLLFPRSSCHFTSLLPLCLCGECPSPIHPTNVSKPCVSHPHFLLVPCVCAVVSTHTTAPSHSLIASSIGCPMYGGLFPWCCVVWLSVESAGRQ